MFFCNYPIIGSESSLPVYLISVGMHELQPHTVRGEYPFPQIFYCTKGSGKLIVDGVTYDILPYCGFFMPAGCPHEYYPCEDIWDIRWVEFSGEHCDEMLSSLGLDKPVVCTLTDTARLEHFFRRMHESLIGDNIFGNYKACGYLYNFIIEFYRLTGDTASGETANPALVKALDLIEQNYRGHISLEDMCSVSEVSPQHLCRLFRMALNCRPMEYLAKRRIKAAKELLSNTDLSVEEIAEDTGFGGGSYFCKLFRRYEGITPSQFRCRK
ncbi:MAG: helix-turn-helix domain-containing protein [Huintestinicola sp.]